MTLSEDENPVVCFCFQIHQSEVMEVISRDDVHTVADITLYCKAGNGCTSCWDELGMLLSLKPPSGT